MENMQELNVISGPNTRSVDNYERARKQSVRSDGAREIHHAKKRKKKVSLANRIKRDLAFTALGAGLTLTAVGISQMDNIKNYFEESAIVQDALSDCSDIVHSNRHFVKDEKGQVQYNNADALYYYDTVDIGVWMKNQIESGRDEKEVVYGIYSNMHTNDDDLNQFYDVMRVADLSSEQGIWAIQHGYESMDDKNLKNDVRREIVRNYNIEQNELTSMLDNQNNLTNNSSNVIKGGK